jgi:two-component system cell cycle sensor histidine kinase PleC
MTLSDIPSRPGASTSRLACPDCGASVAANDLVCPACGVSLAWAATLAERRVLSNLPSAENAPVPAGVALPRFGEFLLRRGNITEVQLQVALQTQQADLERGQQQTIGQILFEMGAVTRAQLDQASFEQVRQLQEALQQSNRQLEQKVAERTRELQQALQQLAVLSDLRVNFVTNISHILRTPLTSIKGYSALLAGGHMGQLSESQLRAAETISQSAVRLEETVNEILHFIPGAKGRVRIQRGELKLQDLVDRLQASFGSKAVASNVRLRFDVAPDLPALWADAEKIRWGLFQLFDYAVKFTPPGGEVALEACLTDSRVRVSVRDGAPDLPPDTLDDAAQSLPDIPDHLVENVSLGLALVRRIVEAHHAQLDVESLPQAGTIYAFALPRADSAEALNE